MAKKENKKTKTPETLVDKYFVKKNAFKSRNFFIDGKIVKIEGSKEIPKKVYFSFPSASRNQMFEIRKK